MTTLVLIALAVGPIGLWLSFLTLPRWCARSIHRHRLWRLRDSFVDRVIGGELPADHPRVRQTIDRLDSSVRHCAKMRMVDMFVFQRALRANPEATRQLRAETAAASPNGLSPEQEQLIDQYHERMLTLLSGTLLLGSWLGLVQVARFFPRAVHSARQEQRTQGASSGRRFDEGILATGSLATDMAVASTRLGHQTQEWAREKPLILAI